jgi:hypothetical protein
VKLHGVPVPKRFQYAGEFGTAQCDSQFFLILTQNRLLGCFVEMNGTAGNINFGGIIFYIEVIGGELRE